jgi:hypothetical protein
MVEGVEQRLPKRNYSQHDTLATKFWNLIGNLEQGHSKIQDGGVFFNARIKRKARLRSHDIVEPFKLWLVRNGTAYNAYKWLDDIPMLATQGLAIEEAILELCGLLGRTGTPLPDACLQSVTEHLRPLTVLLAKRYFGHPFHSGFGSFFNGYNEACICICHG